MDTFVAADDWRLNKGLLACNQHMLENQLYSDFTLLVGASETKIPVHRYVLMSRSDYFGRNLQHMSSKELFVSDVEPDVFNVLLKYMYLERLEVEQSKAVPVLYASLKYRIHALATHCVNMIKSRINDDNVSVLLSFSYVHRDEELRKTAEDFFYKNTLSCMNSDCFMNLNARALSGLLKSGKLNLRVERIFDYVLKWAETQCRRQGRTMEPIHKRIVCGHEVIKAIKFEEMDPKFFAENVSKSGLLNQDEELEVFRRFVMNPNQGARQSEELVVTSSSGPKEEQQTMVKSAPPGNYQQPSDHTRSTSSASSASSSFSRENSVEAASAMLVSGQYREAEMTSGIGRQSRVLDPRTTPSSMPGTRPVPDNIPMSTNPSLGPKIEIQRFRGILSGKAYMRDNHDGISFMSSHRIKLHGVYVYGSHQMPGKYIIHMKILEDIPSPVGGPTLQNGRLIKNIPNKELLTDGRQKQYLIEITPPLELKSETLYTIDMVMKGPVSYYGRSGQEHVTDDNSDVTITFVPYELALGGTNNDIGQLPGMVIEKCDY